MKTPMAINAPSFISTSTNKVADYLMRRPEKRGIEYPSVTDQLDALYHADVFPKEMADKIKAVKDKYPKS